MVVASHEEKYEYFAIYYTCVMQVAYREAEALKRQDQLIAEELATQQQVCVCACVCVLVLVCGCGCGCGCVCGCLRALCADTS